MRVVLLPVTRSTTWTTIPVVSSIGRDTFTAANAPWVLARLVRSVPGETATTSTMNPAASSSALVLLGALPTAILGGGMHEHHAIGGQRSEGHARVTSHAIAMGRRRQRSSEDRSCRRCVGTTWKPRKVVRCYLPRSCHVTRFAMGDHRAAFRLVRIGALRTLGQVDIEITGGTDWIRERIRVEPAEEKCSVRRFGASRESLPDSIEGLPRTRDISREARRISELYERLSIQPIEQPRKPRTLRCLERSAMSRMR